MKIKILIIISLLMIACDSVLEEVVAPDLGANSLLSEADSIPITQLKLLDGLYQVEDGQKEFGSNVVIKANNNGVSIFCGKNTAFFVLKTGELDSVLIMEGFWRFAQSSETGLASLHIKRHEGGRQIFSGSKPDSLIIRGLFGIDASRPTKALTLKKIADISPSLPSFYIIGHRGGGRNVDRLGASENSLQMIRAAEGYGCNAIEIDVRATSDDSLVIFHDTKLSLRLINEKYFVGKISEYDWRTLRSLVTLTNGEHIPTLREALETALFDTQLKMVWLDIKAQNIIKDIIPIRESILSKAKAMNREFDIILGLPDDVIYNDFISVSNHQNIHSLNEFSFSRTFDANSLAWAPRWSVSISAAQAEQIASSGKLLFTWTLDEQTFIKSFLDKGYFNGILSNYPSLVAYEYYIRKDY